MEPAINDSWLFDLFFFTTSCAVLSLPSVLPSPTSLTVGSMSSSWSLETASCVRENESTMHFFGYTFTNKIKIYQTKKVRENICFLKFSTSHQMYFLDKCNSNSLADVPCKRWPRWSQSEWRPPRAPPSSQPHVWERRTHHRPIPCRSCSLHRVGVVGVK